MSMGVSFSLTYSGPKNWPSFINQFCDYGSLHKPLGRELLKGYLIAQFDMEYETEEDIAGVCNPDEVDEIAKRFLAEKDDYRLARNDALMVFAVYGRRRQNREHSMISEFGYKTWWLTGESKILKYTNDIVAKYGGRYMMRPEFVLNFLTLLPSAAEVRRTYREIFPNLLGIQLARRVEPKVLAETLEKVREAQDLEPGRRMVVIGALADKLKSDFAKKYDLSLDTDSCGLDDIQS
jgi:hypothetical protein